MLKAKVEAKGEEKRATSRRSEKQIITLLKAAQDIRKQKNLAVRLTKSSTWMSATTFAMEAVPRKASTTLFLLHARIILVSRLFSQNSSKFVRAGMCMEHASSMLHRESSTCMVPHR